MTRWTMVGVVALAVAAGGCSSTSGTPATTTQPSTTTSAATDPGDRPGLPAAAQDVNITALTSERDDSWPLTAACYQLAGGSGGKLSALWPTASSVGPATLRHATWTKEEQYHGLRCQWGPGESKDSVYLQVTNDRDVCGSKSDAVPASDGWCVGETMPGDGDDPDQATLMALEQEMAAHAKTSGNNAFGIPFEPEGLPTTTGTVTVPVTGLADYEATKACMSVVGDPKDIAGRLGFSGTPTLDAQTLPKYPGSLSCTYDLADSPEKLTVEVDTKPANKVAVIPDSLPPRLTGYEAYVWSQRMVRAVRS